MCLKLVTFVRWLGLLRKSKMPQGRDRLSKHRRKGQALKSENAPSYQALKSHRTYKPPLIHTPTGKTFGGVARD